MNNRLVEAEKALAGILAEKKDFKSRHDEAFIRVQSCRERLTAAQEDLREAKIAAVLDEAAQSGIPKKKKAVTGLLDELEDAEVQVIALSRKIVELEKDAETAQAALRKTKIDLLVEKCDPLRKQYNESAARYEDAFRRLSVCVGALMDLNARNELKIFPELLQFPRSMANCGMSPNNILQLRISPTGELARIAPFVSPRDEQERILSDLLQ